MVGSRQVVQFVGSGSCGYNGENVGAISLRIQDSNYGLWMDTNGNFFFVDNGNYRIRKLAYSTGLVTTIAGNGTRGFSDNLPATAAMFKLVNGLDGDTLGNIYFSGAENYRLRKITTIGIVVTVAALVIMETSYRQHRQ
jgi:hypothetical protein